MKQFKDKLFRFKGRIFRLGDDEPLSILSIIVIIFLDLFLLTMIFEGLDAQAKLITSPDDYIPIYYREIVIEKTWTKASRLDKLSWFVRYYNQEDYGDVRPKIKLHPICQEIESAIYAIKNDPELVALFEERNTLIQDSNKALLAELEQRINDHQKVKQLWEVIETSTSKRGELIKALRNCRYRYPIYKTLYQFLFLIPLFLVFYTWYLRSINKRLQSLLSTHLLIVTLIPIFSKIIQLVIDIIPERLIRNIISFLNNVRLIALWYYLVIGLAIGVTVVIIYFLQKIVFSKEKLIEKRMKNCSCVYCGKKIHSEQNFCTYCGKSQYQECVYCGKKTYINSYYCRECGGLLKDKTNSIKFSQELR